MPDAENAQPWIELLVRMCAGESVEEPFVGVLEVSHEEHGDEWPGTVRVFKDRERYRVETLDGRLLTIRQAACTYVFHEDDAPALLDDDEEGDIHHGAHGSVIRRRQPWDWRGDDFTKPTGPPRAVTYLGRAAWEVELAPPAHKPSALVLTIDAENGMTLEERSVEFGLLSRWTEISEVGSHPDELFTWDGDVVRYFTGMSEVDEEEERQDMLDRSRWMRDRGIPPITVPAVVELFPHERGDRGEFFASFAVRAHGFVARRPRSDDEWDLDAHYSLMERWSDAEWDWAIGTDEDPTILASIRSQLAKPLSDPMLDS